MVEVEGKNMKKPRTDGLGIYIHQLYDDYSGTSYEREREVPLLLLGTVLLPIPLHLSEAARSRVNFSLYLGSCFIRDIHWTPYNRQSQLLGCGLHTLGESCLRKTPSPK